MIPASQTIDQQRPPPRWQQALADAITDPLELIELLGLDPVLAAHASTGAGRFPLRVPRSFVQRIRPGDPRDPLLLQVLPVLAELEDTCGYTADPVEDLGSAAAPGVLQKYSGRALLIASGACAVHCRYCFRRHFPYGAENASAAGWQAAIEWLGARTDVREVILSGGDPLSLSDRRLTTLSTALETLPHIRRLRLHTRQPVVLPERVDAGLLDWIRNLKLPLVIVLHVNHPREIDTEVRAGLTRLRAANVSLFNQSVLLRGVNDSSEVLAELSETLFDSGVVPYYLHVLDRVSGASHFDVPDERARELWAALAARLPGYLVPRLTREIPGAPAKVPIPVDLGRDAG
jgi:EF-P beta-lysylation protein EpmB